MGLSFSKGFGKSRITISSKGLYGSVGLGGGLRYGARLSGGSSKRSSRAEVYNSDEALTEMFSLKDKATWISVIIVAFLPAVLAYMFLWTWLAHIIAFPCVGAGLLILLAGAWGDYKRSKVVDTLEV